MIEQLAFFLAKRIFLDTPKKDITIEENEFEIVQYGLECIINIFVPIFIIFVYSIFTKQIPTMIIWMISFLSLRNYLGGYHASSQLSCMFISTVVGILALLILPFMNSTYLATKILSLTICLFFFSIQGPVLQDETYNQTRNSLFIKGILLFLVQIILIFITLYNNCQLGNAIFVGAGTAYILYLIELIKRKINCNNQKP